MRDRLEQGALARCEICDRLAATTWSATCDREVCMPCSLLPRFEGVLLAHLCEMAWQLRGLDETLQEMFVWGVKASRRTPSQED